MHTCESGARSGMVLYEGRDRVCIPKADGKVLGEMKTLQVLYVTRSVLEKALFFFFHDGLLKEKKKKEKEREHCELQVIDDGVKLKMKNRKCMVYK